MSHIAIYPGTFDPIHFGHIDIAARAAGIFDKLIVAIYDRPAKDLMFTVEERVELARQALDDLPNVRVASYGGLTVEFARHVGAQAIVRGLRATWTLNWSIRWHSPTANSHPRSSSCA